MGFYLIGTNIVDWGKDGEFDIFLIEKGMEEGLQRNCKKMKEIGFKLEIIVEITGLKEEVILL